MHRSIGTLALLAVASLATTMLACSSSSSGGDGGGGNCNTGGGAGSMCTSAITPFVPCVTGSALQSPNVSFATDVQPIFNGCGTAGATCHGAPNNNPEMTGLIFLGEPDGGAPASVILPGIVGNKSPENPAMNIITAGDPENSYLMHKLDGDQCQFSANCDGTKNATFANCGVQMPFNGPYLSQDQRDTVRRWIAQGAKSN
jgi:hypothetical protein